MLPLDAAPALREVLAIYRESQRVERAIRIDRSRAARPASIADLETDLSELRRRLDELLSDSRLKRDAERALDDRAGQLRIAIELHRAQESRIALEQRAASITDAATSSGRPLTAAERLRVERIRAEARARPTVGLEGITSPDRRDAVLDAVARMRLRESRRQLRAGLLMTEQMRQIIAESRTPMRMGNPVLLVGETGGAKTALAEHLSRAGAGAEPEFVSGYGDITTAQLVGTHELRGVDGATVSSFVEGPLLRAMRDGRPLILDELNAMPAEFLKRLNRILQLRPGDTFHVQEAARLRIIIADGFAVIATANEQTPHRYRGLDRLSAELINRFGANTYRVHYPDSDLGYTDTPVENLLLATAAVVDRHGELPVGISQDELLRVARGAFISQQVFTGTHGEGFSQYVSAEHEIDGRPGLEESVLAPRTLVAILEKVAQSSGTISLDRALARFVEGVMHREDRRILALILTGQGFSL